MILKSRYTVGSSALLLLILSLVSGRGGATSIASSESTIQPLSGSVLEVTGTTSSVADDGVNHAESRVFPSSGEMRALVVSDGSAASVHTRTGNSDEWTCVSGCDVAPTLGLRIVIGFDATIIGKIPREFSLVAQYTIGGVPFVLSASADPSFEGSASFGSDSVPVIFTTLSDGNTDISANFVGGTVLTTCSGSCPVAFSDSQEIDLEMEGAGTIDAFHTFTVTLTPTDPNVFLTSSGGRIAGTPPTTAVPEPGTLALLGVALGGLGFSRRRRPN